MWKTTKEDEYKQINFLSAERIEGNIICRYCKINMYLTSLIYIKYNYIYIYIYVKTHDILCMFAITLYFEFTIEK
ncbi:MAG TPA: hypothetical protein DCM20_01800 [Lactococcus lactis]|jgi:hypothetical protein|nr:hypothetical protein [Lactococcus lactis]